MINDRQIRRSMPRPSTKCDNATLPTSRNKTVPEPRSLALHGLFVPDVELFGVCSGVIRTFNPLLIHGAFTGGQLAKYPDG